MATDVVALFYLKHVLLYLFYLDGVKKALGDAGLPTAAAPKRGGSGDEEAPTPKRGGSDARKPLKTGREAKKLKDAWKNAEDPKERKKAKIRYDEEVEGIPDTRPYGGK